MTKPLSVSLAVVRNEGDILFLRRNRGDYVGYWAFPGGKIEYGEHPSNAAIRELREETDIEATYERNLGIVSERLLDGDDVENHFLLHLCELSAETLEVNDSGEGTARWVEFETAREQLEIVPSDRILLEMLTSGDLSGYHECVIRRDGDEHEIVKFE